MLVLSRTVGDTLHLFTEDDQEIIIHILDKSGGDSVSVGIIADDNIDVVRGELLEEF